MTLLSSGKQGVFAMILQTFDDFITHLLERANPRTAFKCEGCIKGGKNLHFNPTPYAIIIGVREGQTNSSALQMSGGN